MTKFALCGLDTALDIELFVKYDSEDIVPGTEVGLWHLVNSKDSSSCIRCQYAEMVDPEGVSAASDSYDTLCREMEIVKAEAIRAKLMEKE